MGQAKQRGTFEQRQAEGIAKKQEQERKRREAKKRCPAGSKVVHVKVTISETAVSSNVDVTGASGAFAAKRPCGQ